MHRSNALVVLLADLLEGSTSRLHVATNSAKDANVGIRVDKDFNIESFPYSAVYEHQDAFYDDDRTGRHGSCGGATRVGAEVVAGYLDAASRAERIEVFDEKLVVERIRMVVVEQLTLFKRHVGVVPVVAVVIEQCDLFLGEAACNVRSDSALS